MSLLLPEVSLCLLPPISGFSLFRDSTQMANWAGGVILFPRGKQRKGWLNQRKNWEGTRACPNTSSAWQPHGIFFPIIPSNKPWVLLYYLVRHWLILEPWVFIQDRLDGETLDVWDSCS